MTRQTHSNCRKFTLNALERLLPGLFRPKEESCVIEGVCFFGRVVRIDREELVSRLTCMELHADQELHLLRHFSSIPDGYGRSLIGKFVTHLSAEGDQQVPISREMIEQALATTGACEWRGRVTDPRSLFDLVKQEALTRAANNALTVLDTKDGAKIPLGFTAPDITSLRTVIPVEDIPSELRNNIGHELRGELDGDRHLVKTLEGVPPPDTSRIAAVISLEKDAAKLLTAYAGELAPEFPNPAQGPQERAYAEEFWERHVFLVREKRP